MKKLFTLFVAGIFALSAMAQTVYYVKTDGSDTNNDGQSWGNAFATLTKAFSSSVTGDEIRVGQGTFTNTATYSLSNKSLTLKGGFGTDGIQDYSQKTVIDANSLRMMTISSTGSELTFKIDGFVFKNGVSTGYGGAISFNKIAATISNCDFSNNRTASYGGGGVYFASVTTSCTVVNCKFYGNSAKDGGGIYSGSGFTLNVINSTIAYNTATSTGGGGGGGIYGAGTTNLYNSIIYGNKKGSVLEQLKGSGIGTAVGTFYFNHNIIEEGKPLSGGNFNTVNSDEIDANDVDPLFIDATTGDLHLSNAASPAINSGDNTLFPSELSTDLDNNQRIFQTTVDLGCYEFLGSTDYKNIELTKDIQIYPNPSSDFIKVNLKSQVSLIEIKDLTGKSVLRQSVGLTNYSIILDVRKLSKGLYILSAGNNTSKVVIK